MSLSLNKIYKLEVFEFLDLLQDNSVDLAIIDPPYNLKIDVWDTFKTQRDFLDFSFMWIDKMLPKLKNTASFYIFNTPFNCALFLNYLQNKKVSYSTPRTIKNTILTVKLCVCLMRV